MEKLNCKMIDLKGSVVKIKLNFKNALKDKKCFKTKINMTITNIK